MEFKAKKNTRKTWNQRKDALGTDTEFKGSIASTLSCRNPGFNQVAFEQV